VEPSCSDLIASLRFCGWILRSLHHSFIESGSGTDAIVKLADDLGH